MLMRLMSKGEYLIVPKGTKFTGSGKSLGRLIFQCHFIFEFLGQFTIRYIYIFFHKGVDFLDIEHKHANFWLGEQYPLGKLTSKRTNQRSSFLSIIDMVKD